MTNAAWDLTLVQYWLYLLQTKPAGIHYLLCSFDGALRRAAQLGHSTQPLSDTELRAKVTAELVSDWGPRTGRGAKLAGKWFHCLDDKDNPKRRKLGANEQKVKALWAQMLDEYENFVREIDS